jgi:Na+:H+ antiporter, NhaA family
VNLLILPLFALTNAGINVDLNSISQALISKVTWGVAIGLLLGKLLGITLVCFLFNRLAKFPLPKDVTIQHIIGMGFLGGIGFTMSIFMADLSFPNSFEALAYAKSGILLASLLAAVLSILWFKFIPVTQRSD